MGCWKGCRTCWPRAAQRYISYISNRKPLLPTSVIYSSYVIKPDSSPFIVIIVFELLTSLDNLSQVVCHILRAVCTLWQNQAVTNYPVNLIREGPAIWEAIEAIFAGAILNAK